MGKSSAELLQIISGVISAIVGVITISQARGAAVTGFWLPVALAVLLLVGGAWLLWRGLTRKSRLLRPERLLIDPDNPDHLRGRDDEIRRLAAAVTAQPLVFLEGESGAGKSALVRCGLVPALRNPPGVTPTRMLPVYLNSYGGDWEQGLFERLVDAFWHGLGPNLRQVFEIEDRDTLRGQLLPSGPSPLLGRIRAESGLLPLLILDQFDDYQVANRARFLRDGSWIDADELVTANSVWRRIRQEVERGSLHLLFIIRRDLFAGLETVRFGHPRIHALGRVEPAYIAALSKDLTTPATDEQPVISHPDAGWDPLRRRLIDDLSEQGRVLPVQARVVFRGLTKLPLLTVAAYERHGGLEGLEAAHIEDAVGAAAHAAGLTVPQVLRLLSMLVDDSDPDMPKARNVPAADLATRSGIGKEQSGRVLSVLDQKGVVRHRAGDGADISPIWSLYHDHLARAVVAANRHADRWQRLLQERHRALQGAGSWASRWRALLSPREQLRLIGATRARKVRWADYRMFAAFSGLRLLPFLMMIILAWVGTHQALEGRYGKGRSRS